MEKKSKKDNFQRKADKSGKFIDKKGRKKRMRKEGRSLGIGKEGRSLQKREHRKGRKKSIEKQRKERFQKRMAEWRNSDKMLMVISVVSLHRNILHFD